MAKKNGPSFVTISIHPLSGALDTRSRPADIPLGSFRWKLNWRISSDGKLCRRDGWSRAFANIISGGNYTNADHHHQGATREPITLLYESTSISGTRRLFDGTQSRVSVLSEVSGYWTDLLTGLGAPRSRWKIAQLKDQVLFTNGVNAIYAHTLGSGTAATIPDLTGLGTSAARVIIEYNGFMLLMNFVQGGVRNISAVRWSDLNLPLSWVLNPTNSLAGFQLLDDGDEILAASKLLGSLYIFTRRAIWKASVSPGTDANGNAIATWNFQKVYSEPKNQAGCLVYPNTLVSDGENLYYMSREAIYRWNPFLAAPECNTPNTMDWLYKAAGVIYRKSDTMLNGSNCEAPVGEYRPLTQELWFSWPSATSAYNNWTLVAHTGQRTADVVDAGFTAFVNYRRTPIAGVCNETQDFLAASAYDFSLKVIGGTFAREYAAMPDPTIPTNDLPLNAPDVTYLSQGYYSILRGMVPTALNDREKIMRDVLVDHATSEQSVPCAVRCRIGNSFHLADPNDTGNICVPAWRQHPDKLLQCPDKVAINVMQKNNKRPSDATHWPMLEQGRFLYYEITVANQDGTPAIGGDVCMERIDFDVLAMPKP